MRNADSQKRYLSITLGTTLTTIVAFVILASCTDKQAKAKPNFIHKDAPKPGLMAKINGQDVTEDQLIGDDKLDFFDLEKRKYDLEMERLNKLVVDRLVGDEAKKAGMTTDEYINKKVIGNNGEIKISDKEYKKFVADKHIPETQINPQIKDRINSYLQQMKRQEIVDAYVAKLTKSNPVEVYFKKPKMQVNVDVGNAPIWGNKDANVTIVEFSDFQCPFCGRANETVTELKKKYNGKIKIAYKQFPLPMHHDAHPAAEASLCVFEQGNDKFWKFSDVMFKNQEKLDAASLSKYAKDVGADAKKFDECVAAKKYAKQVDEDQSYGEKIGVKSTPTFFINGQILSGAVPLENFSEIIDEELEARK